MSRISWPLAIVLSLLIHAALALAYWQSRPTQASGGAIGEGEYGFEIGLGMAGSYTDAVAREQAKERQRQADAQAEAEKQRQQAEQRRIAQAQAEARKTKPEPKPETPTPPVADTPSSTPETADYHHRADSVESPPPAEEPVETQTEAEPKAEPEAAASEPPSQASRRASGSGSQQKLGGRAGAARDYFSTLMAWLNHHKRYPKIAKKNKEQGIVKLKFTVAKDGSISGASIHTSSGHSRLGEAALQMLRNADPVPGIPNDLGRDTLTLVIPIEYSLITNNSYME